MITGIVMMILAVLGVGLSTVILGGSIDVDEFGRDVVMTGSSDSEVPGQIGFRIIEDISSGEGSMTVGVATDASSGELECRVLDVSGAELETRAGSVSDSFVSASIDADWEPVVVAEDLPAGEYSVTCEPVGEPSESALGGSDPASFRVGRIVTVEEMFDVVRPVFGIFAAVALGGLVGLIGLILLIVGLVMGNRARRGPPRPPAPQYQQWGQEQWGREQWGQNGWGQTPPR